MTQNNGWVIFLKKRISFNLLPLRLGKELSIYRRGSMRLLIVRAGFFWGGTDELRGLFAELVI